MLAEGALSAAPCMQRPTHSGCRPAVQRHNIMEQAARAAGHNCGKEAPLAPHMRLKGCSARGLGVHLQGSSGQSC